MVVAATAAVAGSSGNLPRSWAEPFVPEREALQPGTGLAAGSSTLLAGGGHPRAPRVVGAKDFEQDPDLWLGLSIPMSEYLALERERCSCEALCVCDWRKERGYPSGQ
jgi:hypothetical protein